jgi:tetratricopeptide (TPR) repeat protein
MTLTKRSAACLVAAVMTTAVAARADELEDARALYARGKAAYDAGDYQEALSQFSRAYALHPTPALLFNMAQASRLSGAGHCAEALELYERYLERDPAPENPAEIRDRIAQMRACASEESPPAAPPKAPEPRPSAPPAPNAAPAVPSTATALRTASAPEKPRPSPPLAAMITTGIGASLAIAGGILYLQARSKYDDARAVCPCPQGTYSDWETLTTVSYALMATGVVVSGTGAAFWIFSGSSGAGDVHVSGAGLSLSGRF